MVVLYGVSLHFSLLFAIKNATSAAIPWPGSEYGFCATELLIEDIHISL
jgi:hypothetical protein